ncbi:hypothetical protein Sros01_49360 [Streptomyces roseochromogenus]|nr:hypothetical protein Sros01_49360 [Streptomyces roseochromogenus]
MTGGRVPLRRHRMQLDDSQRAWATIIGVVAVILADIAAIVLMNTVGR